MLATIHMTVARTMGTMTDASLLVQYRNNAVVLTLNEQVLADSGHDATNGQRMFANIRVASGVNFRVERMVVRKHDESLLNLWVENNGTAFQQLMAYMQSGRDVLVLSSCESRCLTVDELSQKLEELVESANAAPRAPGEVLDPGFEFVVATVSSAVVPSRSKLLTSLGALAYRTSRHALKGRSYRQNWFG
jgi:hypothetical protein